MVVLRVDQAASGQVICEPAKTHRELGVAGDHVIGGARMDLHPDIAAAAAHMQSSEDVASAAECLAQSREKEKS